MLERWFWLIEQQQLKVITGKEYLWVLKCEVRSDTGNLQILIFYHSELVRKDYLFLKSKDYLLVFFPAPNDVINLFWWSLKYINWRQKTRQELKGHNYITHRWDTKTTLSSWKTVHVHAVHFTHCPESICKIIHMEVKQWGMGSQIRFFTKCA